MNRSFARFAGALTLVALVCGGAPAARAVNIQVAMPIVTTTPGSTVDIPIDASHLPVGQGIYSIDMRLRRGTPPWCRAPCCSATASSDVGSAVRQRRAVVPRGRGRGRHDRREQD